jgi:hypothetical protein
MSRRGWLLGNGLRCISSSGGSIVLSLIRNIRCSYGEADDWRTFNESGRILIGINTLRDLTTGS